MRVFLDFCFCRVFVKLVKGMFMELSFGFGVFGLIGDRGGWIGGFLEVFICTILDVLFFIKDFLLYMFVLLNGDLVRLFCGVIGLSLRSEFLLCFTGGFGSLFFFIEFRFVFCGVVGLFRLIEFLLLVLLLDSFFSWGIW